MTAPRKFVLLEDRFEHKANTVVYLCMKADYGLSSDDERATGEEHLAVTLHPAGDYPFFTAPKRILQEVPRDA